MNLVESLNLPIPNTPTSNEASVSDKEEQNKIMELINGHPVLKSFLTGAFSGTCSTLLFQPLDLVKTRLQNTSINAKVGTRHVGMVSLAMQVVRNEKLVGLWKGTVPSVARCVPGVGMYFCTLHWLQVSLKKETPGPFEAVFLGVFARSLAGVSLLPFTVVKTRCESGIYEYKSLAGALGDLYRTEGRRGLFSGLVPTLFRDAPFSGLYLLFYTQAKRFIPDKAKNLNGGVWLPYINFLCGLTAGSLASVMTQPADVIKTKMQLRPSEYHKLRPAILMIYHEQGALGFFRGLFPRLVRRTLMAAMAWTIYEQAMRGVGFR